MALPRSPIRVSGVLLALVVPGCGAASDPSPLAAGSAAGTRAMRAATGRIAPPLFGWGLLAAVPVDTLERIAEPLDENADGISGELSSVPVLTGGGTAVGRCGWKSAQPDHALANQAIWPYSDLLLHDMGVALAEPRAKGAMREWRTPPLWGIGLMLDRYPQRGLLHDGRARDLLSAIAWHGGEARAARDAVRALSATDRAALVVFLRSL